MPNTHNHLVPAIAVHPGEILQEEIAARGMTQRELADTIHRPIQAINAIVNGRKGISAETALDLEQALAIPAEFWMQLEANYKLDSARQEREGRRKAS